MVHRVIVIVMTYRVKMTAMDSAHRLVSSPIAMPLPLLLMSMIPVLPSRIALPVSSLLVAVIVVTSDWVHVLAALLPDLTSALALRRLEDGYMQDMYRLHVNLRQ